MHVGHINAFIQYSTLNAKLRDKQYNSEKDRTIITMYNFDQLVSRPHTADKRSRRPFEESRKRRNTLWKSKINCSLLLFPLVLQKG